MSDQNTVKQASKLGPGDAFPAMRLELVDGGSCLLPDDLSTPLTIVLFYRGHW